MRYAFHSGRGLTLVELLVAIALFVSLLAVIAYAQTSLSKASSKGLALAELLHQSSVLMERLRDDYGRMQPHAGLRVEIDPTDPAIQDHTFMYTIPYGAHTLDVNAKGWNPINRTHYLSWVHWDFHPARGLRRGESRPSAGRSAAGAQQQAGFGNGEHRWDKMMVSSEWGRFEVPHRQMRHFFNRGDPDDEAVEDPDAAVQAFLWLEDDDGDLDGYHDPFMPYRRPNYHLGNQMPVPLVVGQGTAHGNRFPPPNDGWNSHLDANDDGIPDDANGDGIPDGGPDERVAYFGKDRLNIMGIEDAVGVPSSEADFALLASAESNPYYPSQVEVVAHNVEFFSATLVMVDGTEIGPEASPATTGVFDIDGTRYDAGDYLPDDRASGGPMLPIWAGMPRNATPGLDVDAARLDQRQRIDLRRDEYLRSRPVKIRFRFVMHNMFEDPQASGYQDANANPVSINKVRAEFYALPVADRSHELFKRMVERAGRTAIVIDQVVPLP